MKETTFSEITDLDNKLFRTIWQLFAGPEKVLMDTSDKYTSASRYALGVIGMVFFLIFFIDAIFFPEELRSNEWRIPLRLQDFNRRAVNLEENFAGLITLLSLVPGTFLASKMVFYRKGSFSFFYRLSLFLLAQASIIVFVAYLLAIANLPYLEVPFLLILALYLGYFFIRLKFNSWYITIPKVAAIVVLGFAGLLPLQSLLQGVVQTVFMMPDRTYAIEKSSDTLFSSRSVIEGNFRGFSQITGNSDTTFFIDEMLTRFGAVSASNEVLWVANSSSGFISGFEDKTELERIIDLSQHRMILIFGDSLLNESKKDFMWAYSYDGSPLFSHDFGEDLVTAAFEVYRQDSDAFYLRQPYRWDERDLFRFQSIRVSLPDFEMERQSVLDFEEPVHRIYPLGGGHYLTSIIEKPDWHFVSFKVARYDSLNRLLWKETIYDKGSPYDPRVPQLLAVDTFRQEVIAHYSLANDTIDHGYFACLDLTSGQSKWNEKVSIPGDYTEYKEMAVDERFIYVVGETHRDIVKTFWQPQFHISTVMKIDRKSGKLIGHRFFGNDGFGGHSRFSLVHQQGEDLVLYGHENDASLWQVGDPHTFTIRSVLPKENL